jgi:hypothetical protein
VVNVVSSKSVDSNGGRKFQIKESSFKKSAIHERIEHNISAI